MRVPCCDTCTATTHPFKLLVLSGFSGSGKDTVLKKFREEQRTALGYPIEVITSYTTRPPRPGEKKYHFVTKQVFSDMVQTGQFLEYNQYGDHFYGTPVQSVRSALKNSVVPCLEIDCTGFEKLLASGLVNPDLVISVFITVPAEELYSRLCNRRTETQEQIRKRLQFALEESYHVNSYKHILTNDTLDETVNELQKAFEGRLLEKTTFNDVQFRKDVKRILDAIA